MFPEITDILQNIPHERPYAKKLPCWKNFPAPHVILSPLFCTLADVVKIWGSITFSDLNDAFEPESKFQAELLRHCLMTSTCEKELVPQTSTKQLDEFVEHRGKAGQMIHFLIFSSFLVDF